MDRFDRVPRDSQRSGDVVAVYRREKPRVTVTEADLKEILSTVRTRKYTILFALLAGTGLRIGEALALRPTDFGPDCRVLHIRRSIWRGQEQQPKTANALRVLDLPEVLAKELRNFVGGVNGYLFATAQGKPLQRRNDGQDFGGGRGERI
jgi:integrase